MRKLVLLVTCFVVIAGLVVAGCGGDTTTTTAAPATTAGPVTTAGPDTTAAPDTTTTEAPPAEAEVIKLSFVSEKPLTHIDHTVVFPALFEMVEQATNGKYKFEIEWFPVNTISAPADNYDAVKSGIVDVGQSSMGYTPRAFPLMQTAMQPGISPPVDTRAMSWAGQTLFDKYQPAEFADTKILFIYACGPGWLKTNKPIQTVAELKGMRIRCSGTSIRAIELAGGDPIAMPMADVYEAAQKGTIDALLSPAETLDGWKHAEIFSHSMLMNQLYASDFFWVAMNLNKWNSLPDDLKAAFESVAMDMAVFAGAVWDYAHDKGFAVAEPLGHTVVEFPEAEKTKLAEVIKPVKDEYLAFLNQSGLPGEQIINDCVSIMEEANAKEFMTYQP